MTGAGDPATGRTARQAAARTGARNPFRAQPAAYSPIGVGHLLDAAAYTVGLGDACDRASLLLRRTFDVREAHLYQSGTAALQSAIVHATTIVGTGSPVALPAFTCFEVATAAVGAGATIALYDLDPETLAPDLDSVEAALRAGARTVVLSQLYGVPFDWETAEDLVASYGAIAIEDAAQGHGASWRGRPLGAHGQVATVSFGRGKGWTASGGGALLLRESPRERFAGQSASAGGVASELGALASGAAQWALGRPAIYGLPASIPWLGLGETRYHEPAPLRRMSRASARLLVRTAAGAELEARARRASAERWAEDLPGTPAVRRIHPHHEGVAGYLRYPVRLTRGLNGFGEHREHARRLGIAPTYPATLAELPAVQERLRGRVGRWTGAQTLVRELVTLPTHSLVTEEARARILELLAGYPAASFPPR